ncbi:hypothetical protein C6Q05_01920 [Burkholderia multivorans]|nr:hypothetical protein C6Q05_01920 [Burkholderia multivorans]
MHALWRDARASCARRGPPHGDLRSGRPPRVFLRAHASTTSRARCSRFACRARRTARATQTCASQV